MHQVSILGLGIIGSRIARHMISLGDDVTVWNRTPREGYPRTAASPADAVRASRFTSRTGTPAWRCLNR